MVFTIDQIYKEGVPRKQFYWSPVSLLSSGNTSPLTVSPATTPENWAILIERLKVHDSSFVTSGTGTGVLQIQYPDYPGANLNTYVFESLASLKFHADEVIVDDSDSYYNISFKPPILLKASNSESDFVVGLPSSVDISSGELKNLCKGWTLKEGDYD